MLLHKNLSSLSNRKCGQSPDPASCHGVLLGWLRKLRSKSPKVLGNEVVAELILARGNSPVSRQIGHLTDLDSMSRTKVFDSSQFLLEIPVNIFVGVER